MALRIGGVPVLLSPSDVASGIRALVGWTDDAVELVADLPARVDRLLGEAEALLGEMRRLAERVEHVAASAEQVVSTATAVTAGAESVIAQTTESVRQADEAIAQAARAAAEATGVLALYQPIAEKAAPMARQFVEEFSTEELHAAIRMVDTIPRLTAHLEQDVLPLLGTLDHVGPDLRELISLVTDVRNALASVPGFRGWLRREEPRPGNG
ncbi:hypothetical protein ACQEVB_01495 [Pseudonocardia sp. CA-107938]|uniref:hypothetical protein n=1 Tax=Pseudonocardia sp. CA-107938 TaxID=3240021 RepID=UPI003D943E29